MATISNKWLKVLLLVTLSYIPCRCQRRDYGYGDVITTEQDEPLYTLPPPYVMLNNTVTRTTVETTTKTEDSTVVTSRPLASQQEEVPAQYHIRMKQTEELTGKVSSTVMCIANKPLRSCMLKLPALPIIDYSAGLRYVKGAAYEYGGKGLNNGDCSVRFRTLPSQGRGEFRCEGSYLDGSYNMTLHYSTIHTYPFGVHLPSDGYTLDANVSQPVSIPCVSSENFALTSCHFWVPGIQQVDLTFGQFSQSSVNYEYKGKGLRRGYCELRLKNVKKEYSGVVWCWGGVGKDRIAVDWLDFQVVGGLSDGAVAGIIIVLVGFFVAVSALVYGWRKRRWCFSSGNGNADSDTEYDEIKNFAPKVPPYPTPQRLHLMAPSPHDSGYIEAVTIHNPEFDKHKANLSPPIKETHSINESRPTANQAPANVYEHLKEPQVKAVDKKQSVQEKAVEKETDSVLQDRPGTYMFMRGVPEKPADKKMEDPKYLSLFDPESVKLRHSKKEHGDQTETLYENLERVKMKSTGLQDHPMFD